MKYLVAIIVLGVSSFQTAYTQVVTADQLNYLRTGVKTICVDTSLKQPQWSVLLPHIKGKRIIAIGEVNHGSKEIFTLRNSLIKYLHQEAGFNTILFESGIGELIYADLHKSTLTSYQLAHSLVGVWHTREFVELMEYVKANQISIAGFDVQRAGISFHAHLKDIAIMYQLDTLSTNQLESRYGGIARELASRGAVYDSLKSRTTTLIRDYQSVNDKLATISKADTSRSLLLTRVTLENRIQYLSYMLQFLQDKNWSRRWAARDSAMARNTRWLLDNVYKDQRVIILAHNYHIGKFNELETVMGEILRTSHQEQLYTIGVFAGSGSYSDNFGKEVIMTPPSTTGLDIKHLMAKMKGAATFLDIPDNFSAGSQWLTQPLVINDTFIDLQGGNKMILSQTFDGLLFLKRVSPAKIDR